MVENLELLAQVHVNRRLRGNDKTHVGLAFWGFGLSIVILTSPRNRQNEITMCRYKFTTCHQYLKQLWRVCILINQQDNYIYWFSIAFFENTFGIGTKKPSRKSLPFCTGSKTIKVLFLSYCTLKYVEKKVALVSLHPPYMLAGENIFSKVSCVRKIKYQMTCF